MKLHELLSEIEIRTIHCDTAQEVTSVAYHTKDMERGGIFVAIRGNSEDGHDYIADAVTCGVVAVVCEVLPEFEGPWVLVSDSRMALAAISANWFGCPSHDLYCHGVTGTNGKTSSTYLLKHVLEQTLGAKVGLVGTNQNMIGEEVLPASHTTPESYELQKLMRLMADKGCTHVVMEVSSIALDQHRVAGIHFKTGVFTNLTQDHLDYHGTMESYREAKKILFQQCESAVINVDDRTGEAMARELVCPVISYSRTCGDIVATQVELGSSAVSFTVDVDGINTNVQLPIPGEFTIYNAMGVLGSGLAMGLSIDAMAEALGSAKGVPGRIEVVDSPSDYTIIIDYAHTPDALRLILESVRKLTTKRVICLFGCGGDRDKSKRSIMGGIASELSDLCVVTSDNPRREDPQAILRDILKGMSADHCLIEVDRRKAIRLALRSASSGDVVLLAGKGHETYQEVGTQRIHLDEREEVRAYFSELGK